MKPQPQTPNPKPEKQDFTTEAQSTQNQEKDAKVRLLGLAVSTLKALRTANPELRTRLFRLLTTDTATDTSPHLISSETSDFSCLSSVTEALIFSRLKSLIGRF